VACVRDVDVVRVDRGAMFWAQIVFCTALQQQQHQLKQHHQTLSLPPLLPSQAPDNLTTIYQNLYLYFQILTSFKALMTPKELNLFTSKLAPLEPHA
jgi:hypothetical protein